MTVALRAGNPVSVVAPCGPVELAQLKVGLSTLQSWGLKVKTHGDVTARTRYLAGSDAARARALNDAVHDPATRAIFCIRGGYGAARIVERIDWEALVEAQKIFVGFSDVTTFHLAIAQAGGQSLHGPNLTSYDQQHRDVPALRQVIFGEKREQILWGDPVRSGVAEGQIWGGNLTVVVHALASGISIPDGSIVFLEDVGEPDYRIDRALTALAPHSDRINGIVLGDFKNCSGSYVAQSEFPAFLDGLALEFGDRVDCPVVTGFPFGHSERNVPLPFGRAATIDGSTGRVEFVEDLCFPMS